MAGTEQAWTASGWAERFALPLDVLDIGYGHRPDQVALVTADVDLLGGYDGAVHANTLRFVRQVSDADLDRVVDERWDPPVTLGVRLISRDSRRPATRRAGGVRTRHPRTPPLSATTAG